MGKPYHLSLTAIRQLKAHRAWSRRQFGEKVTRQYFADMDKGVRYIAKQYTALPARPELTGTTGMCIYPVREHYVVFVPLSQGIFIASILAQSQNVPVILDECAALFRRELNQFKALPKSGKAVKGKPRPRKKP